MTEYENVIEISDNEQELHLNMRNYYMDEIEVLKWLEDKGEQTIRFNDRIVKKENGKFHSLLGPAIKPNEENPKSSVSDQYYLYGECLPYDEWKSKSTSILRKQKISTILNKTK